MCCCEQNISLPFMVRVFLGDSSFEPFGKCHGMPHENVKNLGNISTGKPKYRKQAQILHLSTFFLPVEVFLKAHIHRDILKKFSVTSPVLYAFKKSKWCLLKSERMWPHVPC